MSRSAHSGRSFGSVFGLAFRPAWGLAVALGGFLQSGCNTTPTFGEARPAAGALVRAEVGWVRRDGVALVSETQVQFARYRPAAAVEVPRLLGVADFERIPLDSCEARDVAAELDEALAASHVEVSLLDAGRLELRQGPRVAELQPTHYPEVVPSVAGMVYIGAEIPLQLGGNYQLLGDGGLDVGPLSANAVAPRAFPQLMPLERRTDELMVRWSATGADEEPALVEVKGSTRVVRCRARDDGELAIRRSLYDTLPDGAVTISVTRRARAILSAPGIGDGQLSIVLRDEASVPR